MKTVIYWYPHIEIINSNYVSFTILRVSFKSSCKCVCFEVVNDSFCTDFIRCTLLLLSKKNCKLVKI